MPRKPKVIVRGNAFQPNSWFTGYLPGILHFALFQPADT